MTSRSRRGFTLMEVLVAGSLMLLILGLVFQFLVPTMRVSLRGATRVELQQMAVIALNKLASDLQNTTAAGLSVDPHHSIGIVRIDKVMGDGRQVWETQMIVYTLQNGQIIRKTVPTGTAGLSLSGNAPARVSESQLASIAAAPCAGDAVVANYATTFEPAPTGYPPTISDPVTVSLKLEKQGRQDMKDQAPETFELSRTVSMKQRI